MQCSCSPWKQWPADCTFLALAQDFEDDFNNSDRAKIGKSFWLPIGILKFILCKRW
jgi:hypothetical protein